MNRRELIVATGALVASCTPAKQEERSSRQSKVLGVQEADVAIGINQAMVADLVLVSRSPQPNKLVYDYAKAKAYREEYCRSGNDCPDNEHPLDCTHFACHALNKGGVFIKIPSADCASGLGIRVNDLAQSFSKSTSTYSNVKQISAHNLTKEGDFCFIPAWFGLKKSHVMVLASMATPTGAKVWGHTKNRCAEDVEFEGEDCIYYRIT